MALHSRLGFAGPTADILADAGLEPLSVFGGLTGEPDTLLERAGEKAFEEHPRLLRDAIDNPPAFPDILSQVGIPEDAELMGNPGLFHLEDEHKLANAELPLQEKPENPQTSWVGHSLERFNCVSHFELLYEHIFIY